MMVVTWCGITVKVEKCFTAIFNFLSRGRFGRQAKFLPRGWTIAERNEWGREGEENDAFI